MSCVLAMMSDQIKFLMIHNEQGENCDPAL